jgi:predicted component of type VI protein secretion system
MSHTRRKDQSVDAFSLPTSLLAESKARAAQMRMTKSGFYRYCLAKELGYSEQDALLFAEHRAVLNSVEQDMAEVALNDRKASSEKVAEVVEAVGKMVNYKIRSRRKPAP